MAANMQFTPGDIIQDFEEPLIKHLNMAFKNVQCHCCFKKSDDLQRCTRCKLVLYCNAKCQKIDWKAAHSIECKLFANPQFLELLTGDGVFQIIRLMAYLKLHPGSATRTFQLYDGSSRCLNDLQDNYEEINGTPGLQTTVTTLSSKLADSKLFSALECSYENIIHLYGIWKTNAFGVSNEASTMVIGCALYVLGSSFDHSCRPNALRVIDDTYRIQVRCIDDIPVGMSPKITYLAGIRTRADRQQALKKRFYFNCECVLCESEKDGEKINYDELIRRRDSLNQVKLYANEQLRLADGIIQDMQKVFCKYDERITNFYDHTLEKLVVTAQGPYALMVTASKVKEFEKQVEENLRITYGIGHRDYKYFADELSPRLQKKSK